MNHRDSGFSEPNDVFEAYEERKDNLLDHLVPAQHRSGQPTEVPIRDHNSDDSSLRSMQTACKEAEQSYSNRRQWSPEVLDSFNSVFATVIKEQTPSPEDAEKRRQILERLGAIVAAGLDGHIGLRVEPYGSFVSGLYCPTGDLDISIEGHVSTRDGRGGRQARDMGKTAKAALLRALSQRLERSRLTSGYIQRILHARVPILKFIWKGSGVPCDVSVGSANSRFKAEVVKVLAQIDERFGQMLRLVKVWSGAHGLNDASSGTFNSFALSLMVLFHLQLRQPPVLPPLHELFGDSAEAVSTRPLHFGGEIQHGVLEAFWRRADAAPRSSNRETLAELLASFFAHFSAAAARWLVSNGACDVRASTWCGAWTQGSWAKSYMAAVEDPFDYTDNCARTIGRERLPWIARSFQEAANIMLSARDAKGVERALASLFGSVAPANMPRALRTTEDSHDMLKDRDNFQHWRETRRAPPQPNGTYMTAPKGRTSQNDVSTHDPILQEHEVQTAPAHSLESSIHEAAVQEHRYKSMNSPKAVASSKAHPSTLNGPHLRGSSNADVSPIARGHQPQPPGTMGIAQSQPSTFAPSPLPSHHSSATPTPYYAVSPLAAAQPPPPFRFGAETAGAPSRQQPQQPTMPQSGVARGDPQSPFQKHQQPEGRTPSDVLRKMLNIDGSSGAAATLAQQPPAAPGFTAGGSAAVKAYDHTSSSALRQMLKIPGSSGSMPEAHSSGWNLGGSGGRTSAQRRGGGSLGLPDSLDLGTLDLNADTASSAEARREAEAGPQGQPQPRPPPKAYKARKAVPIKPAPSDNGPPVASIGGPEQIPRQDGRRQDVAVLIQSAPSSVTANSTASGEEAASKPRRKYRPANRRRHPPHAQPQESRTADGNGTQVAGGMPVAAAPAKSSARVVELPRRNVSKRKDVPAAPT